MTNLLAALASLFLSILLVVLCVYGLFLLGRDAWIEHRRKKEHKKNHVHFALPPVQENPWPNYVHWAGRSTSDPDRPETLRESDAKLKEQVKEMRFTEHNTAWLKDPALIWANPFLPPEIQHTPDRTLEDTQPMPRVIDNVSQVFINGVDMSNYISNVEFDIPRGPFTFGVDIDGNVAKNPFKHLPQDRSWWSGDGFQ